MLSRFDVIVHGSEAQRRFWFKPAFAAWNKSVIVYNGVDSGHFEPDRCVRGRQTAARLARREAGILAHWHRGHVPAGKEPGSAADHVAPPARGACGRSPGHCRRGAFARSAEAPGSRTGNRDRVHFLGETDDVRPVLAALDVFVLPSIAVESFSNAALEAMSMGKPVILSEIGGAREMINDGVEGYVVSPRRNSRRGCPRSSQRMYADRRKRQQMGQAARRGAVSRFSVSAMVAGYRACFTESRHERGSARGRTRVAHIPGTSCVPGLRYARACTAVRAGTGGAWRREFSRTTDLRLHLTLCVDPPCRDHGRGLGLRARICVRARGAGAAARAGRTRSRHRAHPFRFARQHAAQDDSRRHGDACRTAAGAARAWRALDQFHRGCPRYCDATSIAPCNAPTC